MRKRYRQNCHLIYENKEHRQTELVVAATNIENFLEFKIRQIKFWSLGGLVQCSFALLRGWIIYGINRKAFENCPFLPPKKES